MYTPVSLSQLGRFAAWCAAMLGNVRRGRPADILIRLVGPAVAPSVVNRGEEQFYLLYPIVLLTCLRLLPAKGHVPLVAGAAAASLALSSGRPPPTRAANYYAPTRAWELLLGALLALGGTASGRKPRAGECARGPCAVGDPGLGFRHRQPDDLPRHQHDCAGACAATLVVTGSGDRTVVNRWLALSPLVFIGLIFLLALPVARPGADPVCVLQHRVANTSSKAGVLLAAGVLAVLTWALVEHPIRFAQAAARQCRVRVAGADLQRRDSRRRLGLAIPMEFLSDSLQKCRSRWWPTRVGLPWKARPASA